MRDVLSHIQSCRDFISDRRRGGGGGGGDESAPSGNSILNLLALYEFETQLVLGSPEAARILDVVKSSCPSPDAKTYENVAGGHGLKMYLHCVAKIENFGMIFFNFILALAIRYALKDGGTAAIVKRSLQIAIDLHMKSNPHDIEKLRLTKLIY